MPFHGSVLAKRKPRSLFSPLGSDPGFVLFPWDKLFKALETSMDKDVALLSIQPDVAGGVVILSAEARDWNAMLGYIRRLGEDKFFTDVHLVSHQIQQSDPQKPVRFVLSCAWDILRPGEPPTPDS